MEKELVIKYKLSGTEKELKEVRVYEGNVSSVVHSLINVGMLIDGIENVEESKEEELKINLEVYSNFRKQLEDNRIFVKHENFGMLDGSYVVKLNLIDKLFGTTVRERCDNK